MRALTAVVVGLAVMAMAASASASIVNLTNTNQLDTSMAKTAGGAPVGGFAVDFMSAANSTVNGLTFASDGWTATGGYTFGYANAGSGFWYGGAGTPAGTDGAAMAAVLEGMSYCSGAGGYLSYTFVDMLTVGQTYKVQFIGSSPGSGVVGFDVVNAGVQASNLAYSGNYIITETFTATSATETFKISANSGYAVGAGIVVSQVPEPATMALLAIGGLGALIRRRK